MMYPCPLTRGEREGTPTWPVGPASILYSAPEVQRRSDCS